MYKAVKSIDPNVTVKLDVLPQFNKQKSETLVYCEQTANNYLDVFRFSPIQMPKKKKRGKWSSDSNVLHSKMPISGHTSKKPQLAITQA